MAPLGTGGRPGGFEGPPPSKTAYYSRERLLRVFLVHNFAALRVGGGVGDPEPMTLGLLLDPSGRPGFRGAFTGAAGAAGGFAWAGGDVAAAARTFVSGGPLLLLLLRGRAGGGAGERVTVPIPILTRCAVDGDDPDGAAGRAKQVAAASMAMSGLMSISSAKLMARTVSASEEGSSLLPNHMGARGRLTSNAREGCGSSTRGGALQ